MIFALLWQRVFHILNFKEKILWMDGKKNPLLELEKAAIRETLTMDCAKWQLKKVKI